jgi:1-deoxy-D-xylulose-5-phosphate reductoisomerase
LLAGGAAPCILNAANEVAVEAFLDGRLGFTAIAAVNEAVLEQLAHSPQASDLDAVLATDREARSAAQRRISRSS